MLTKTRYATPLDYLAQNKSDAPILFYSEHELRARIAEFKRGFKGMLTFAVKCHPDEEILTEMVASGVQGFDVASPHEIALLRRLAPNAQLHYNNPIRSNDEIRFAVENNIKSYSIDAMRELEKIALIVPKDAEISIRIKLDLGGAAYHFGSKFGAERALAVELLKRVAELGYTPSITFHVGTQCKVPELYGKYVEEAAIVAREAGVQIKRLNVGGGFPSARGAAPIDYQAYFDEINNAMHNFENKPELVCEPGRALVGDAFNYAAHVKSIEPADWFFLNDGIYGGLSELNLIEIPEYAFYSPEGERRIGRTHPSTCYGPTCDSVDTLKTPINVPEDVREGDLMLFCGMGAYVLGPNTSFNGYGKYINVDVDKVIQEV